MQRERGQRREVHVPDFVSDEWVARYAGRDAPGTTSHPGSTEPDRAARASRSDTRLLSVALGLCAGVFVVAVVATVVPVAGLLAVLGGLGVIFGASYLMAKLLLDVDARPERRRLGGDPHLAHMAVIMPGHGDFPPSWPPPISLRCD